MFGNCQKRLIFEFSCLNFGAKTVKMILFEIFWNTMVCEVLRWFHRVIRQEHFSQFENLILLFRGFTAAVSNHGNLNPSLLIRMSLQRGSSTHWGATDGDLILGNVCGGHMVTLVGSGWYWWGIVAMFIY